MGKPISNFFNNFTSVKFFIQCRSLLDKQNAALMFDSHTVTSMDSGDFKGLKPVDLGCLAYYYTKSIRLSSVYSTVPPKNNARARSGARSSCAARTRNPPQEIKMICFCGLPARTFKTQEVGSLAARRRKTMKI